MFTLIKNANLYAPAYLGKTDILLCGEKIAHISKTIELNESFCHTIDVQGKIVTPGFIDSMYILLVEEGNKVMPH